MNKILVWIQNFLKKFGITGLGLALIIGAAYYAGYTSAAFVLAQKENNATQVITKEVTKIQTQIVTKYIHDIKYVKENTKNNDIIIQNDLPDTFILSRGWVYAYNNSLQGAPDDPSRVSDATPSGINAVDSLKTITENNASCKLNADQLRDLQAYIVNYNSIIQKENSLNNR